MNGMKTNVRFITSDDSLTTVVIIDCDNELVHKLLREDLEKWFLEKAFAFGE